MIAEELNNKHIRRVRTIVYRDRKKTKLRQKIKSSSRKILFSIVDFLAIIVFNFLKKTEIHRIGPLFPDNPQKKLCLYASYSPNSRVSDMVLQQISSYRDAGFAVVFITMSQKITRNDRERLSDLCQVIIRRRSFGRDFGAWAEAITILKGELSGLAHLLMTNDSNIGPLYPIAPWIEKCLANEGIFGLTESLQNGSHLQSYFLTINGRKAIDDTLVFLKNLKISLNKILMIKRGEIGFSKAMARKGNFVGAILDHETLENALISNRELQAEFQVVHPKFFEGIKNSFNNTSDSDCEYLEHANRFLLRRRLFDFSLNPSHQLNFLLLKKFQFPFMKTELIIKNPLKMPSAPDWPHFVNEHSLCSVEMIDAHLADCEKTLKK